MNLEGCHLCKGSNYPMDAMTINIMSHQATSQFKGVLDMVVHAARSNTEKPDDHPVIVEFTVENVSLVRSTESFYEVFFLCSLDDLHLAVRQTIPMCK